MRNPTLKGWDALIQSGAYEGYSFPKLTVVIPTQDNAHLIPSTIESILSQDYPEIEVQIIDSGSVDRTMEVIKSYFDERIKITSVKTAVDFEMFNKGISLASGRYISFLLPGDRFIHPFVMKVAMASAIDHDLPHLVYGGCLLRDGRSDPKVLSRHLTKSLLQDGKQPTSLQSCWFRDDTFRTIGKFSVGYHRRGGYELMCRFAKDPFLRSMHLRHVFTDFNMRTRTRKMILDHMKGTFFAIKKHFGYRALIRWIFVQRDLLRLIDLTYQSVRNAFFGKS